MNKPEIISVSQYLDKLNFSLKTERAKILGEICDIKEYPERSYLYFSVKDSKDQSVLKCFMWKRDYRISGVTLKDGGEVVITAYPNIYKPNGGLTMQVETVELVGEGALQLAYEELKKKLTAEGLFAEERKREIPMYPHKIGVITSRSGAVINDFLSNIGKFGFEILFVDSKVEGQDAVKDLLAALNSLKNEDLDILVMMRGGGSLESFMAFNNEMLVRAVSDFSVPVLTGIGHDKDISLASLVSDKNVSTPTAVANLLNSSWNEALSLVNLAEQKIISEFSGSVKDIQFVIENSQVNMEKRFDSLFEKFKKAEEVLMRSVGHIEAGIRRAYERVEIDAKDLMRGFELAVLNAKDLLVQHKRSIDLSNPERQLLHGYSIVKHNGKILRSKKDAKNGDKLDILVSDGTITSKVI